MPVLSVPIPPSALFASLNPPITAGSALKNFLRYLTDFEQGEILEFSKIYFLGLQAIKVKTDLKRGYNFGFDNKHGDFNIAIGDHIAY
jgi:dual specificity tyrosine-phosphorylation-regulated kinase 2/3/4